MKLVIHAGMAKTGTSSIQKTLWSLERNFLLPNGVSYASHLGGWNHSNNLISSFEQKDLPSIRKLNRFLKDDSLVKIISAEVVSNPKKRGKAIREGLAEAISGLETSLDIYMYIRSPISFMTSLFVQMLKMGIVRYSGSEFSWPCYRKRIDGLHDLSSSCKSPDKTSLNFLPFEKSLLKSGNVVIDFLDHIEIKAEKDQIIYINESLSSEAVSILYLENLEYTSASRKEQRIIPSQPNRHSVLVDFFSDFGSSKLAFAPAVFTDHIDFRDLEWAQERLGYAFIESSISVDALTLEELEVLGRNSLGLLDAKLVSTGIIPYAEISGLPVSERINRIIRYFQ